MSLSKREHWDAMMEAQFGADQMYDDGGSALAHYKQVLKEAKTTLKLKFGIGDEVIHHGKKGEVTCYQVFGTKENTGTEYNVQFDGLSYWVPERELLEAK